MENASKALLIASGVLLAMLIVMLLLFFGGRIKEFYTEQGQIDDIENVEVFNKQFTNYERNKVYGYELISLANMVEDYNNRHSGAAEAKNDEKYNPITLVISFKDNVENAKSKIWYENTGDHLFGKGNEWIYSQSDTNNKIVNTIKSAVEIENRYGGDTQIATKLAKSINSLIVDENDNRQIEIIMNEQGKSKDEAIKILQMKSVENYQAMTNDKQVTTYEQLKKILLSDKGYNNEISIKKYYEYNQFKRSYFKCSEILYDNDLGGTGRVKSMKFEFIDVE